MEKKHPGEPEYHQAFKEVLESIEEVYNENPRFAKAFVHQRLIEPDVIFTFKVPWVDDKEMYRSTLVTGCSTTTPSARTRGTPLPPNGKLSILKFLGFEQIFKNSLTTLPMGGGKGGSDFDPKGKSDNEVMRFCQSFMLELWKHIGPETDVPAGDIGVGGREIGFLYGMYKKLAKEHTGVLTGKGLNWGGSLIRPEATGFGCVYFANEMLKTRNESFEGKKVAVSGFGNVAWGAATKATELGATVVTISGPDGYIHDPAGISGEKIDYLLELRASNMDVVEPYAKKFPGSKFVKGMRPWEVKVDIALPCATQNELYKEDAELLVANGATCVCEGANMPCTPEAIEVIQNAKLLFAPARQPMQAV